MLRRFRSLTVPFLLFAAALLADHLITQHFLAAGGTEGNIVAIWLWEHLPLGPNFIAFLWGVVVTVIALLLAILRPFLGRWLLYGAFMGHLEGFLSWTPVLTRVVEKNWELFGERFGLAVLLGTGAVIGFFLALVHGIFDRRITRTASGAA